MQIQTKAVKLSVNALGFQAAWWLTVAGVVMQVPWLGPAAMLLYMAADHYVVTPKRQAELQLILLAMVGGTIADSLFISLGLLNYAGSPEALSFMAPLWITAMWGGFAATLNHSLGWIKGNTWLAILMGAIFGPLSYLAGAKFNAITFVAEQTLVLAVLAVFWGAAIPGLITLHKRLEQR